MRLKTLSGMALALCLCFASSVIAAPAAADPDQRAAAIEAQLTDAERIEERLAHRGRPVRVRAGGFDG